MAGPQSIDATASGREFRLRRTATPRACVVAIPVLLVQLAILRLHGTVSRFRPVTASSGCAAPAAVPANAGLSKCPLEGSVRATAFGHSDYHKDPGDARGVTPSWATPLDFLLACDELAPGFAADRLAAAGRTGKPSDSGWPWPDRLWWFLDQRAAADGQPVPCNKPDAPVAALAFPKNHMRLAHPAPCLRGAAVVADGRGWRSLDQQRLKTGLVLASDGDGAEWRDNIEEKRRYAERHGYGFHFFAKLSGWPRTPHYNKVLAMLSVLHMYDWIMMSDLDAIIMQPGMRLEEFIDPHYNIVASVDCNGPNSGVVFWRNSTWTAMFLLETYGHDRADMVQSLCYNEQAAFQWLVNDYRIRNHVKLLPNKLFNSYPEKHPQCGLEYSEGDFMIHYAGTRKDLAQLTQALGGGEPGAGAAAAA